MLLIGLRNKEKQTKFGCLGQPTDFANYFFNFLVWLLLFYSYKNKLQLFSPNFFAFNRTEKQAEVELRLTQAEAVRLQFACELSILLDKEVGYEEELKIEFCKMTIGGALAFFLYCLVDSDLSFSSCLVRKITKKKTLKLGFVR